MDIIWCTSCSGKRQSRAETSAPPKSAPPKCKRGVSTMLIHLFRVLWVVMDSNHRRHRQQIYSLPHLATLVTTRQLLS